MARSSSPLTELVGRDEELVMLRAQLDRACVGDGGLIVLAGEAGIGKTRLAEELAVDALVRGALVLWGRCYEGEGAPAYWPWLQILRTYCRSRQPAELVAELGPGAADIAQLIPELRQRLPDLAAPTTVETAQARFRLFDSVTLLLIAAAERQPLVLILDDLHWADRPSLLLLQFLARELGAARLLVLGTYRDSEVGLNEALAQTLAELAREPGCRRLALHGLSEPEVIQFIESTAGLAPPADLVAAVARTTEGNPFFLGEVVRLLMAEGRLTERTATTAPVDEPVRLPLPQRVREVIGRRLARLGQPRVDLLALAAVIGREFSLTTLQQASQTATAELIEALDAAETAQIIVPLSGPLGHYSFSHALIRETLYDGLTSSRRRLLHARVGEALEVVYGPNLTPHLTELAHHFVKAAPLGDARRAVDYARRAGSAALERHAYEEAASQYQRALAALAAGTANAGHERCRLLLDSGTALRRAGQPQPALSALRQAAELAMVLAAPVLLASAALGVEETVLTAGLPRTTGDEASSTLLERALAALGDGHDGLRVRLLAALARALFFSGQPERGVALSREAVALARQIDDPAALVYALDAHRVTLWGPDQPAERLAVVSEIARLGEITGDRELALDARLWRQHVLIELGDGRAADAEINGYATEAERLRQPVLRGYALLLRSSQALRQGRFDEGERLLQQVHGLAERTGSHTLAMIRVAQLLVVRRERGGFDELTVALTTFGARMAVTSTFHCALALIASLEGRTDAARHQLDHMTVGGTAGMGRMFRLLNLTFLADVCAALDAGEHAAWLYDELLPYATQHVLGSSAGPYSGPIARYLMLLATTLERWEAAVDHAEAALSALASIDSPPWLARTRAEYAGLLLRRASPGDHPRAAKLLAQATASAHGLGMSRLLDQLAVAQAALAEWSARRDQVAPPPLTISGPPVARPQPHGLTSREVEILTRLASGESNRQIASALSLSVRTVEHHVAHIYSKIGVDGRVAAAAFALRLGLIPSEPADDR